MSSFKAYTLYDRDGNILGTTTATRPPVGDYVEGVYDQSHRIVGGKAVKKSQKELDKESRDKALNGLRGARNSLLTSSDWTQMPDSPLSDQEKQQWATYRQALRDLPANTPDPLNVTWPEPPTN